MGSPHSCALQLAHWPRCQGIPASRNKHLKQNNNNKTKLDSLKETFHVKQAVLRIEPVQGLLNREPPVMAILGLLLGVLLELLGDEPCHAGAGWVETIDCRLQLWLTMTLNRWQWSKDIMSNYLSKPKCFTAGWASSRKQWSCVTFQPPSHLKTKKKWFLQQLLNIIELLSDAFWDSEPKAQLRNLERALPHWPSWGASSSWAVYLSQFVRTFVFNSCLVNHVIWISAKCHGEPLIRR